MHCNLSGCWFWSGTEQDSWTHCSPPGWAHCLPPGWTRCWCNAHWARSTWPWTSCPRCPRCPSCGSGAAAAPAHSWTCCLHLQVWGQGQLRDRQGNTAQAIHNKSTAHRTHRTQQNDLDMTGHRMFPDTWLYEDVFITDCRFLMERDKYNNSGTE